MCRIFLLWAMLATSLNAGGYSFVENEQSDYSPFPVTGKYDPFGNGSDDTSVPPVIRDEKPTGIPKAANAFGRDRAVIIMAEWCIHCPKEKVATAAEKLRKNGWKIGPEPTNQIQILDVDKHTPEADRVFNALDQQMPGLPFMVAVEGGKIVRRLETGCTTPIDQWSLGWLATGIDERPDREKEPATVRRSGNYPLRGGWWTVNQYPARANSPNRNYIVSHLLEGGKHAGKFATAWLNSLTIPELHSLHSDDHEGHVRWGFVNKYASQSEQPLPKPPTESVVPGLTAAEYATLNATLTRLEKVLAIVDTKQDMPKTTPPKPAKITTPPQPVVRRTSACPTGRCPYSSQRIRR